MTQINYFYMTQELTQVHQQKIVDTVDTPFVVSPCSISAESGFLDCPEFRVTTWKMQLAAHFLDRDLWLIWNN